MNKEQKNACKKIKKNGKEQKQKERYTGVKENEVMERI